MISLKGCNYPEKNDHFDVKNSIATNLKHSLPGHF